MRNPLLIGITLGDINGIGPEVALKAVYRHRWPAGVHFVFVGDPALLSQQARKLKLPCPPAMALDAPFSSRPRIAWPSTTHSGRMGGPSYTRPSGPRPRAVAWDPAGTALTWKPGAIDPAASASAAQWILAAAHGCLTGRLDAMVTAPISKEGFHRAGVNVPGHTELLAELCGTRRFAMMLFGGPLRVVLATRHIPLADVPKALTPQAVEEAIRLTAEALPWMGARRARIAVCGLNPHAGEGGDIGREDLDVIAPVVRRLRASGIKATGPLPGDTVFHAAARGDFDAVVAMYHDQGLAPLKLVAFDTGVNITLGLPLVRTSPDHGTAFDLAGKNRANPASMIEAVRWAIVLAKRRNPWKGTNE